MKSAEMQVLRFDAGDVIATSVVCTNIAYDHYYVKSTGENTVNGIYYVWSDESTGLEKYQGFNETSKEWFVGDIVPEKWYYYDYDDEKFHACDTNVTHPHN